MSGYKTHFLVGLILTCLAGFIAFKFNYLSFSIINAGWLLAIAFIFSLLPDVDIGTSLIRKVLLVAFVIFIFINGMSLISYILGVLLIIIIFLPHRGIMHTFFMGALLSGMLWFYFHSIVFPIIALLNFVSHMVMDKV